MSSRLIDLVPVGGKLFDATVIECRSLKEADAVVAAIQGLEDWGGIIDIMQFAAGYYYVVLFDRLVAAK